MTIYDEISAVAKRAVKAQAGPTPSPSEMPRHDETTDAATLVSVPAVELAVLRAAWDNHTQTVREQKLEIARLRAMNEDLTADLTAATEMLKATMAAEDETSVDKAIDDAIGHLKSKPIAPRKIDEVDAAVQQARRNNAAGRAIGRAMGTPQHFGLITERAR